MKDKEFLENFGDAGGIFSTDNDCRRASKGALEFRESHGLGGNAKRAVLDNVKLGFLCIETFARFSGVSDGDFREVGEDDVVGLLQVRLDLFNQVIFFGSLLS